MTTPTPRQSQVLDFIRNFLRHKGFPPTHAEIAAGLGFRSPNAAASHVRLLAKKGLLEVSEGVSEVSASPRARREKNAVSR
jgi:repressor LexA